MTLYIEQLTTDMPLQIWNKILEYGVASLAKEINVSRAAIYAWQKRGSIPAKQIQPLSAKLDMSFEELAPAVWPDA